MFVLVVRVVVMMMVVMVMMRVGIRITIRIRSDREGRRGLGGFGVAFDMDEGLEAGDGHAGGAAGFDTERAEGKRGEGALKLVGGHAEFDQRAEHHVAAGWADDGETGRVTPPDGAAVGAAAAELLAAPARARRMGEKGFEAVRGITWEGVVTALLRAGGLS